MDMSQLDWEGTIREREEETRVAFLAADVAVLNRLWVDGFVVNSPLQTILDKGQVLGLLQAGRIRHTRFEVTIERIVRHGDTVIVMGHDTVTDPPDGVTSRRRFTNVWQFDAGEWRSTGRHAHVVSREPAADATPSPGRD